MQLIVPPGTRIVTGREVPIAETDALQPGGAVGVIVRAPADWTHAYRVRFPDGGEASLRRDEFRILNRVRETGVDEGVPADTVWMDYVIFRCIVGSRAFGLDTESSDVDRRGIYLPSADLHRSLFGVPEQLENEETQETYWELGKFIRLALKANPGILECLYTPLIEDATDLARELLGMRCLFLSRLVYQTYNGYVLSQFRKLEPDLRTRGTIKWKHAMHLIRLLLSGITIMREHTVPVRVEAHRDRLLAIRRGEVPWEDVDAWRLEQLYSPLVLFTSAAHEELCDLATGCITRHHVRHYAGFAGSQWRLFEKETPPRVKPLLYASAFSSPGSTSCVRGKSRQPQAAEFGRAASLPRRIDRAKNRRKREGTAHRRRRSALSGRVRAAHDSSRSRGGGVVSTGSADGTGRAQRSPAPSSRRADLTPARRESVRANRLPSLARIQVVITPRSRRGPRATGCSGCSTTPSGKRTRDRACNWEDGWSRAA